MPHFTPYGAVASSSLIIALIKDNGQWADDVLAQCFAVPADLRKALLSGAATWQTPNSRTLIIIPAESQ